MKLLLITDLHWGCRNDLQIFYDYFDKFYNDLVTYMNDNNLKCVFILGDVFDRRKFINFKTLNAAKRYMFDKFKDADITVHVVLGNHDIHYRESLELSSPMLVLGEYDNVHVYTEPTTVQIENTTIDLIPWLCKENENQIMNHIKQSSSDLCFGHFEFVNFPMHKGIDSLTGMSTDMFEKYELVCSGHYHTKSQRGNINYIGTPYEMCWEDCDDPKGFHTFDLTTRELTFHQNLHKMFYKIEYDENVVSDVGDLTNKFVKLIVVNKTDLFKYDMFLSDLYSKKCYDIKILDNIVDVLNQDVDDKIDLEDILDVLGNYIDKIDLEETQKNKFKMFMKSLYIESINSEVV